MEIIGGIVLALVLMALLSVVGLVTVTAFAFMAALGLLSNMSFKRLFFVSFGLGLLAPILLGMTLSIALEEGELQREFSTELRDILPDTDQYANIREAIPQIQDLREQRDEGQIDRQEFEDRLEQIINDASGVQVDLDGIDVNDTDGAVQIQID